MASKSNSRGPEIQKAESPLQKMKLEIATELGVPDYDKLDKGDLPARLHGKIGGNMVKRMITNYENLISNPANASLISQSNKVADNQLAQDKQIVQKYEDSMVESSTQPPQNLH